jgi:molybdate transport system substrate-binding protein
VGAAVVALVAAACGTGGDTDEAAPVPRTRANGYITVVAADSIAPTIEREARAFEAAHRLSTVRVESGPSSALATQLRGGRSADLYVAGGTADMDRIVDAALIYDKPVQFARSPSSVVPVITYSIAMMDTTGDQSTSRVFMRFLDTPQGRRILDGAGFRPIS